MMRSALTLFLCAASAIAQEKRNGSIVEETSCPPNPISTYEQYVEAFKHRYEEERDAAQREGFHINVPADLAARLPSMEEFERRKTYAGFECRRITYLSDGLKVTGFIWKPKNTEGKKFPLIIFNRGGNREFGKLTPWMQSGFYSYLSSGFVVIGSQYRGIDGGEGHEEFGGADVRDVLNLIPLAESLGYVDMRNVFILGWSRGGMESYVALKSNIPVNAVAIGGGLTDLIADAKKRPAMLSVYRELIPDFDKRGEELMRERSALSWPEKINAPVFILQGGADWRSDVGSQALAFAQRLQELGKTYQLIVYADDDHGVSLNREDSDRRIVEWFKRYMR